jgi:hypothetical protein
MRVAQCQCGGLSATAEGEPDAVVVCSCTECQRRTGSVFASNAYYPRERLTLAGAACEYVRTADSGQAFHSFFCPACGTTLWFFSARDPGRVGIAVGAFADASFAKPDRTVFDESKHGWVVFDADVPGFTRGRDSPRSR